MVEKLHPSLSTTELIHLKKRFHFEEKDFELLQSLYHAIIPLLEAKAYYELNCLNELPLNEDYAICLITLGQGIDQLADLYLSHEQLSEAYMIDCLGLELLSKSYEAFIKIFEQKQTKTASPLYVEKLSFLGDQYSLSLLPSFFSVLKPEQMSYNQALMITPTKSASIILPLSSEKKQSVKELCNTCASCTNLSCPSRKEKNKSIPNTYGAMQIFNS